MSALITMPEYEAYKESEVEWIGSIPSHWNVKKAKFLFDEIKERSLEGKEELLSVSHITGVTPRSDKNVTMFMAEDYSGSKLCRENDLVMNIMWAWMGAIGVSDRLGIVSPSYGVFRPKHSALFNSRFIEYLLKTPKYIEHYNRVSTGLHSSRLRFYAHMFFDMKLGYPSYEDQNIIIEFIDNKTSKIDEVISIKEQQIDLLKERKKIIIQQAVTQGLNPDVSMKYSGVDWIGEIPEHWEVKPLTKYSKRVDYRGKTPEKVDEGRFLLTTKNIKNGRVDYEISQEFIKESQYESVMSRGKPKIGDLLFTMEAPLGASAVVDNPDVAIAQRIIKFDLDLSTFYPEFLNYFIQTPMFQVQLYRLGTGSTAIGIKASKLCMLKFPTPSVQEQKNIYSHIQKEAEAIDAVTTNQVKQIEKLKEYKATLINSAVTGKIKVPEVI